MRYLTYFSAQAPEAIRWNCKIIVDLEPSNVEGFSQVTAADTPFIRIGLGSPDKHGLVPRVTYGSTEAEAIERMQEHVAAMQSTTEKRKEAGIRSRKQ